MIKGVILSLCALVLLGGSACTKVFVSVQVSSYSSALTGLNCKLKRELRNQKQETDFWCWAASAHTVLAYLKEDNSMKQCDLLNAALGVGPKDPNGIDCCKANDAGSPDLDPPSATACWKNGWPEDVFDRAPFPVVYERVRFDPAYNGPQGLEWREIVNEICEDRPIITAVAFLGNTGGHALVIGGYTEMNDGRQWVHVYDPGSSTLEEDYYVWPYEKYLGADGVFTHIRDYKNISIP